MSLIDERTTDFFHVEPVKSSDRGLFVALALFCDTLGIIALSIVVGLAYHATFYGTLGPIHNSLVFGAIITLSFAALKLARGEYAVTRYAVARNSYEREMWTWSAAFICVLCVSFLVKTTELYSRGAVVIFYGTGLIMVPLMRSGLSAFARAALSDGRMVTRRTFLVGSEGDVLALHRRLKAHTPGIEIVGSAFLDQALGSTTTMNVSTALRSAVAQARHLAPDDIIIVVPWANHHLVESCVDAFMTVPAAIHLAPERVLDRFEDISIAKLGPLSSLQLTRPPHHLAEIMAKRMVDVLGAGLGLILLAPFLAVIALLIKLDTPGPVFFMQQRWGLNQKTFRIFKFRTMTSLDDGVVVQQATRGDKRITKLGAWLRRYSIDELPQLINVLLGEMSIVGPRPHAVAHNRAFEQRISLYARRHNVKPGITGWAQVNGYRGETDTDDKMRLRVEHDLYYIDNWSLLFDIRICLMTFLSPATFKNAY